MPHWSPWLHVYIEFEAQLQLGGASSAYELKKPMKHIEIEEILLFCGLLTSTIYMKIFVGFFS